MRDDHTRKRDATLKQRSRELRRNMTPAEAILWDIVRDRRLAGFKFRRQHILGPYVADYYCPRSLLIVELDGETHCGREVQDANRQRYLESLGIKVLRFWNNDVYDEREAVLEVIYHECVARDGSPPPPA